MGGGFTLILRLEGWTHLYKLNQMASHSRSNDCKMILKLIHEFDTYPSVERFNSSSLWTKDYLQNDICITSCRPQCQPVTFGRWLAWRTVESDGQWTRHGCTKQRVWGDVNKWLVDTFQSASLFMAHHDQLFAECTQKTYPFEHHWRIIPSHRT